MSTLKGVFSSPRPTRRNFILENVRRLQESQKFGGESNTLMNETKRNPTSKSKFPKPTLNVPAHVTTFTKSGSKTKHPVTNHAQITKSAQVESILKDNRTKSRPKAKKKEQRESEMAEYVRQQCEALSRQNHDLDLSSNGSVDLEFIKSPAKNTSVKTHRTTASQTMDSKNMDKLYMEGTIRYPSVPPEPTNPKNQVMQKAKPPAVKPRAYQSPTYLEKVRVTTNTLKNLNSPPKTISKPSGDGFGSLSNVENNFDSGSDTSEEGLHQDSAAMFQRNARKLSRARNSPPRSPKAKNNILMPQSYQRGVVPKYLQKRQEEKSKNEEIQKVANVIDPLCPPNHILLPEHERKETVKMLRKNYADFVKELNMMPVRTDTLRMQKRKMELEKQLNKLEEGIKLFSRPKVYVKIGT